MKWLKHQTDSHTNLKIKQVIRQHGVEGYGLYWICNELVGSQGKNYRLSKDKDWKTTLAEISKVEPEKINILLKFFASLKLIDNKSLNRGHLFIPKMEDYADEYTKKALKKSGQSPDNIPLKQNKTTEKKTNKNNTNQEDVDEFKNTSSRVYYELENLNTLLDDGKRIQMSLAMRFEKDYGEQLTIKEIANLKERILAGEKINNPSGYISKIFIEKGKLGIGKKM